MPDNVLALTGNLTRAPELRYMTSGRPCTTFTLAVNRNRKNAAGEWEEVVSFFDVVTWADLAEHVAESLNKGDRVIVQGRLEQRQWETDNGERRSAVQVAADDVGPSLRFRTASVNRPEPAASKAKAAPAADDEPF